MPIFSHKQGKTSEKGKRSKAKGKQVEEILEQTEDEVIVAGVTPVEEAVEEDPLASLATPMQATPFSDGIVASCLSNLVVIPRIGGQEVDLLRSFLSYFVITDTFIGTITMRASFMKKKGGTLL